MTRQNSERPADAAPRPESVTIRHSHVQSVEADQVTLRQAGAVRVVADTVQLQQGGILLAQAEKATEPAVTVIDVKKTRGTVDVR